MERSITHNDQQFKNKSLAMYLPYSVIIEICAYQTQKSLSLLIYSTYIKILSLKKNIIFFNDKGAKNISITYLPLFEFQEECDLFATQLFNYINNDNHNSKNGHCIKTLFSATNHLASLVHLSFLTCFFTIVQFKMFFFFYSFYFIRTPIFTTVQLNCN